MGPIILILYATDKFLINKNMSYYLCSKTNYFLFIFKTNMNEYKQTLITIASYKK